MSSLTLLCAGALLEPAQGTDEGSASFAVHGAAALQRALSATRLGERLRRARVVARHRDEGAVPRELPSHAWLRAEFDLPAAASIAACSAFCDAVGDASWRLTPVHLHVGLDHLVLTDPSALQLEGGLARALADAAAPILADEGLELLAVTPERWYLRGDALGELSASESVLAIGRNVDAYLPRGEQARRWRRIETMLQMAWFEHTANSAREALGLPSVNSLWIEGCVGRPARRPFDQVWTADAGIRGLAVASGTTHHAIDEGEVCGHGAALEKLSTAANPLVVLDGWFRARVAEDVHAWQQAWDELAEWIAGGRAERPGGRVERPGRLAAASRATPQVLRLVLTGERGWVALELAARDRWAPWRRLDLEAIVMQAAR